MREKKCEKVRGRERQIDRGREMRSRERGKEREMEGERDGGRERDGDRERDAFSPEKSRKRRKGCLLFLWLFQLLYSYSCYMFKSNY